MASYTSSYSFPTASYRTQELALDIPWLMKTCSIQGRSGDEVRMRNYLIEELNAMGLSPEVDTNGNLYVQRGEADVFPCMVAHMDTVHNDVAAYQVWKIDNFLCAFNMADGTQTGVGGDRL